MRRVSAWRPARNRSSSRSRASARRFSSSRRRPAAADKFRFPGQVGALLFQPVGAQGFEPALHPDGFLAALVGRLLHLDGGACEALRVLPQEVRTGLGDPTIQRIQRVPQRRFPGL